MKLIFWNKQERWKQKTRNSPCPRIFCYMSNENLCPHLHQKLQLYFPNVCFFSTQIKCLFLGRLLRKNIFFFIIIILGINFPARFLFSKEGARFCFYFHKGRLIDQRQQQLICVCILMIDNRCEGLSLIPTKQIYLAWAISAPSLPLLSSTELKHKVAKINVSFHLGLL